MAEEINPYASPRTPADATSPESRKRTWLRSMSWRKAFALSIVWFIGVIGGEIGIFLLTPYGMTTVAFAESVMLTLVLGAPVAVVLIHRSLKPFALLLLGYAMLLACGLAMFAVNYRSWERYRRQSQQYRSAERWPPASDAPSYS